MTLLAITLLGTLTAFAITLRLAAPRPRMVPLRRPVQTGDMPARGPRN